MSINLESRNEIDIGVFFSELLEELGPQVNPRQILFGLSYTSNLTGFQKEFPTLYKLLKRLLSLAADQSALGALIVITNRLFEDHCDIAITIAHPINLNTAIIEINKQLPNLEFSENMDCKLSSSDLGLCITLKIPRDFISQSRDALLPSLTLQFLGDDLSTEFESRLMELETEVLKSLC